MSPKTIKHMSPKIQKTYYICIKMLLLMVPSRLPGIHFILGSCASKNRLDLGISPCQWFSDDALDHLPNLPIFRWVEITHCHHNSHSICVWHWRTFPKTDPSSKGKSQLITFIQFACLETGNWCFPDVFSLVSGRSSVADEGRNAQVGQSKEDLWGRHMHLRSR